MAKELKASVRLDTKNAVRSLEALEKKINKVQRAVNKVSTANSKFDAPIKKAVNTTRQLDSANKKAANSANQIAKGYQKSNSAVSVLTRNLKTLVSTYVGIMGAKAVIGASDTVTSAENRLNNLAGATPEKTTEAMDKMYTAAQRSRSAYNDMLSNVSKTMTLAGDSFDNNIDNAIKFQEIMAKAYTVGGASAAEKSSSMYQLVQALGSGILQGDELRSVREGAPIAYKEIEKFAQGVYNTTDSLKEMASQGLITSDMVVAAIMNAGDKIDKQFNNTKMTFAQAWDSVANMALQAFRPVLQMFNNALNSDAGKALIEGLGRAFVILANIILWVGDILGAFFNWCVDNWYWLQWVVFAVVAALVVYFGIMAAQAVIAGIKAFFSFLLGLSPLYVWIIVIGIVIGAIVALANTAVSGMEFIFYALLIVAAGLVLVALLTQAWWLLWVALAIAVVALVIRFIEQIVGAIYWLGAVCYNVVAGIANVWNACWMWVGAVCYNVIHGIGNFFVALWNSIRAIAQNIGIAFSNAWNGALSTFWNFIASCLEGLDWLAKPLEAIAELFGKSFDYENFTANIRDKANGYASKQQDYVSVSDAWNSGIGTYDYKNLGDAWSAGMNTNEYKNLGEAYRNGAAKGAEWSNAINEFGNGLKDKASGFSVDDLFSGIDLTKLIGTDGFGAGTESYLPQLDDPAYALNTTDPNKLLENISGNTDDIKDSMDLSNDDLDYLRKIADMEWRNEFTTAEIKVDMTNNNMINGERDLDGIVSYLSDVLREEMTSVAYGVHY